MQKLQIDEELTFQSLKKQDNTKINKLQQDINRLTDQVTNLHQSIVKDIDDNNVDTYQQLLKKNQKLADKYELAHQIIDQYRNLIRLIIEKESTDNVTQEVERLVFKSIKQLEETKYQLNTKTQQLESYKQTVDNLEKSLQNTQIIQPNQQITDISLNANDLEDMIKSNCNFYQKIQQQIENMTHYNSTPVQQIIQKDLAVPFIHSQIEHRKITKQSKIICVVKNLISNVENINNKSDELVKKLRQDRSQKIPIFNVYYEIDTEIKQLKNNQTSMTTIQSIVNNKYAFASEQIVNLLIVSNSQ